jgi:hypothetical protein
VERKRNGGKLSEAELDLIAPHPVPATTRWVRPISSFTREETHDGSAARYG